MGEFTPSGIAALLMTSHWLHPRQKMNWGCPFHMHHIIHTIIKVTKVKPKYLLPNCSVSVRMKNKNWKNEKRSYLIWRREAHMSGEGVGKVVSTALFAVMEMQKFSRDVWLMWRSFFSPRRLPFSPANNLPASVSPYSVVFLAHTRNMQQMKRMVSCSRTEVKLKIKAIIDDKIKA